MIRRLSVVLAMMAMMAMATTSVATAGAAATDLERREAAGWGCADAVGLPDGHCINPATARKLAETESLPQTFQLHVFDDAGKFVTAEIATFKTSADNRACPNDPESPDGTYWEFVPGVLYVCHHQAG